MVFATPHAIRESSRSKLQPETDIRPLARGLLQRFRLDAIVSRPVYLCDHDTGCCQDGKFPFQIARTNSASGNSFRSVAKLGSFTPRLMKKLADTASRTCGFLLRVRLLLVFPFLL